MYKEAKYKEIEWINSQVSVDMCMCVCLLLTPKPLLSSSREVESRLSTLLEISLFWWQTARSMIHSSTACRLLFANNFMHYMSTRCHLGFQFFFFLFVRAHCFSLGGTSTFFLSGNNKLLDIIHWQQPVLVVRSVVSILSFMFFVCRPPVMVLIE